MDTVEKNLVLEPSEVAPNLYVVVWRGGPGKVPNELLGTWTKRTGAAAIERYMEKKGR